MHAPTLGGHTAGTSTASKVLGDLQLAGERDTHDGEHGQGIERAWAVAEQRRAQEHGAHGRAVR